MARQVVVGQEFTEELEVFRTEEEAAQQCFFAYLGIRNTAAESRDVLRAMNENPMFWIMTEHALILSTFIILGRVFDTDSKHNVGKLMSLLESNRAVLSRTGLKQRREPEMTALGAAEYVKSKHDLTVAEIREIRFETARSRRR
jgi:AbiU2